MSTPNNDADAVFDVSRAATLITVVLVFGLLVALALFFLYKCTKLCLNRVATSSAAKRQYTVVPDDVMRHTTIERFLQEMAEENPILFTAEQLAGYTGNYSARLGRGGFGTVYKGVLPNGLAVAVKVLHDPSTSEEQFKAEVGTIGRTHHINLVRLYGFCLDGAGATHALVYEFMEHGALNDYLSARGAIATGVARGLRYLHEECQRKIVHYDIKPANVLLDGSLTPKVADFGLACLVSLLELQPRSPSSSSTLTLSNLTCVSHTATTHFTKRILALPLLPVRTQVLHLFSLLIHSNRNILTDLYRLTQKRTRPLTPLTHYSTKLTQ
jgi:hypothetical protein